MPLTRQQSEIWQAMDIGPQWILRTSTDPLAPPKAAQSVAAVTTRPAPAARPVPGTRPSAPAAVHKSAPAWRPAPAPRPPVRPSAAAPVSMGVHADPALAAKIATASWEEMAQLALSCRACPMAATRVHPVLADGAPGCPLVIVGEAPGREEDLQGLPFVGKSGQLLDQILQALTLARRKDVAIINVLKCRPPQNRDPLPDEVAACRPFLERQLQLLAPKVLVLMGRHAVHTLLDIQSSIGKLRGTTYQVKIDGVEVPTIVTYHPSYLLRNPVEKDKSWKDMLRARDLLRAALASTAQAAITEQ